MDEYAWPTGPEVPAADLVRESWEATVAALPVEARITGEVIGRQRFGVFIRIDGVPYATALAEITAMPLGMDLAALGAFVSGEVIWHAAHNHQVKVQLDEWRAADE
ncbi:hypothetical protein [Streptomyces sp. CB01373]|uniref:hypothetical protein n=1 Tax=Streptomyces sp. CB01373 TaxID=2020325 RepID=UPI0018FEE9D5|nr:hypothetical protein [Streptomyces sp. CB01373]